MLLAGLYNTRLALGTLYVVEKVRITLVDIPLTILLHYRYEHHVRLEGGGTRLRMRMFRRKKKSERGFPQKWVVGDVQTSQNKFRGQHRIH